MGCDIHSFAEVKVEGKWIKKDDVLFTEVYYKYKSKEPFSLRSYSIFGFLANVRNYSESPVISEPRGLPLDSEYLNTEDEYNFLTKDSDYHSFSWILLKEFLDYDYNKSFIDERNNHEKILLKDFLGYYFFKEIEVLKTLGNPEDVRIVFYFDN